MSIYPWLPRQLEHHAAGLHSVPLVSGSLPQTSHCRTVMPRSQSRDRPSHHRKRRCRLRSTHSVRIVTPTHIASCASFVYNDLNAIDGTYTAYRSPAWSLTSSTTCARHMDIRQPPVSLIPAYSKFEPSRTVSLLAARHVLSSPSCAVPSTFSTHRQREPRRPSPMGSRGDEIWNLRDFSIDLRRHFLRLPNTLEVPNFCPATISNDIRDDYMNVATTLTARYDETATESDDTSEETS